MPYTELNNALIVVSAQQAYQAAAKLNPRPNILPHTASSAVSTPTAESYSMGPSIHLNHLEELSSRSSYSAASYLKATPESLQPLLCARRTFLASQLLRVAHKFIADNASYITAWAHLITVPTKEVG